MFEINNKLRKKKDIKQPDFDDNIKIDITKCFSYFFSMKSKKGGFLLLIIFFFFFIKTMLNMTLKCKLQNF